MARSPLRRSGATCSVLSGPKSVAIEERLPGPPIVAAKLLALPMNSATQAFAGLS